LPRNECFYEIRSNLRKSVRWEKVCKDCKRTRRATRQTQNTCGTAASSEKFEIDGGSCRSDQARIRIGVSSKMPSGREGRRADGQVVYKAYRNANGDILELTKEEFDRVVDLFKILRDSDAEQKSKRI